MESMAPNPVASGRVPAGRLLRVGVLAAALSASANALVLAIASSFLGAVVIPSDGTVTFGQVVGASVAGAVGAAAIFAVIGRFTRRPIHIFWGVAAVGLFFSFLPIALAGARGSTAGTLALMHVVAAVTNVGLLTTLGRKA
jgi:putative exporter of polyketide antibiotics